MLFPTVVEVLFLAGLPVISRWVIGYSGPHWQRVLLWTTSCPRIFYLIAPVELLKYLVSVSWEREFHTVVIPSSYLFPKEFSFLLHSGGQKDPLAHRDGGHFPRLGQTTGVYRLVKGLWGKRRLPWYKPFVVSRFTPASATGLSSVIVEISIRSRRGISYLSHLLLLCWMFSYAGPGLPSSAVWGVVRHWTTLFLLYSWSCCIISRTYNCI